MLKRRAQPNRALRTQNRVVFEKKMEREETRRGMWAVVKATRCVSEVYKAGR